MMGLLIDSQHWRKQLYMYRSLFLQTPCHSHILFARFFFFATPYKQSSLLLQEITRYVHFPKSLYFHKRYQTPEPSLGPRQFHVGSQTQDERYTSALMPEVDVTPRTFLSNAHCRKRQSKNKHTKANIPKHCCFFGRRWKTLWKTWTPLERFLGRRKSVNQIIYVFIHNNESASSKRKCERYPHLPQCLPTSSFKT